MPTTYSLTLKNNSPSIPVIVIFQAAIPEVNNLSYVLNDPTLNIDDNIINNYDSQISGLLSSTPPVTPQTLFQSLILTDCQIGRILFVGSAVLKIIIDEFSTTFSSLTTTEMNDIIQLSTVVSNISSSYDTALNIRINNEQKIINHIIPLIQPIDVLQQKKCVNVLQAQLLSLNLLSELYPSNTASEELFTAFNNVVNVINTVSLTVIFEIIIRNNCHVLMQNIDINKTCGDCLTDPLIVANKILTYAKLSLSLAEKLTSTYSPNKSVDYYYVFYARENVYYAKQLLKAIKIN